MSYAFPSHYTLHKANPYYDVLHNILGACYRPDVGYVQGMSFIEAGHILNEEEVDVFTAFGNLMSKSCQSVFFCVQQDVEIF